MYTNKYDISDARLFANPARSSVDVVETVHTVVANYDIGTDCDVETDCDVYRITV